MQPPVTGWSNVRTWLYQNSSTCFMYQITSFCVRILLIYTMIVLRKYIFLPNAKQVDSPCGGKTRAVGRAQTTGNHRTFHQYHFYLSLLNTIYVIMVIIWYHGQPSFNTIVFFADTIAPITNIVLIDQSIGESAAGMHQGLSASWGKTTKPRNCVWKTFN